MLGMREVVAATTVDDKSVYNDKIWFGRICRRLDSSTAAASLKTATACIRFRVSTYLASTDSPRGVDGAVDTLPGAEVGEVKRSDDVGSYRLRAMALAPVHVWPSRLHQSIYMLQSV